MAEGGDSWWGSDARLSRSRAEPPEGEYATRAELAVVRRQKLGAAGPIKDLGDAANALHYLIRSAVERVDVLVTSARGKPLAIIGGFKGELASSPVMPVTLLAEAVQVPGAANLWVVHNHPSGATDLSEADRALAITLSRQFDGTGIAVRGMIAVSKSGWGGVWVEGSRLSAIGEQAGRIAPVEGKTVPALERQLSSDGKLDDRSIYTAQAGREAALAAAGVYNSPVIIMLDMRHRALAVVPWSGKDAAQLKNNGKLDALLRAASTANAGRAIIALGDGMTKDQARNLATGLQRAGVTTLDIVDKSGNSSASVGEGLYADVLRSAHRYANSPEFQRWFEGSKVVDKSGRPLIVYHGTTHDISAFDVSVANVESDWGAGIYFTTSPVDASQNYAGLGPDLLSRVERLADTIAHERQITPEAALGVALTQLSGGAPNIIPAYLSMRNPFIVGGPGQTFLGHEYDPENEDAAPSGDLQRIIDAIYEVPDDIIDFDPDALVAEISQAALDDGGLTAEDLDAVLRASSAINESSDPATGDYLAAEVERMILEYAGFDGVIDRTVSNKFGESSGRAKPMAGVDHNTVHYVIFDPTQAKSAIGNRGTFSPNDADVTRSAARARFDTPETSRFDDLVYKLQDKHIDTKRVVDAVRAVDADLREDLDVYLQEELFHGRVAKRTEDFVHHELQPLVDAMRAKGLTVADLDEYLHARHAREANEVIAQRDPEIQDGGSGMLNQDAEAYFAGLPQDKRRALEEVSIQVDAMLRKTRDLLVSYELESRAKVQGWADMFEHYVPLMREDEGGHTGTGQGFSIRGKEVKSRTGSTRRVVDILANIAMQRERTIVRGEKNRVSQALFGLAALSPNEAFWDVDTHVPTEPVFNPATGLVEDRPDTMYKLRPNVVVAKFAGEGGTVSERAVVFNEKNERALRMAEALKNLDAAQLEGLLGASAKLTRYFASINTQYNPVFGVVNLIRDVQEAMVNLGSTELAGKRATIARATPRALAGIYSARRAERSGERSSSDWARLWDEFQRVGGQTGYRQLFVTSADRADAIRATLDPNAWMDSKLGRVFTVGGALKAPLGAAQRAAKWIFDWLSDYNEAMENGVRLAAYRVGLDAGLSKERAASVAKNLTVNFNRRGQAGQQAGALYAFFNASMQGTARVARTLFDMDPGKPKTIRLSKTGKKVVYGGMLLGSIQAFALAAAGFGDDDPPEWARQRNLIIPLGGKKYVSIPLPLGLLVIPSIGRSTTEWALGGFEDTSKRVEDMVSMFADAFNPIGNAGLSMQTLAPTALDPLVALTENRDWTGRPIARTSSNKAIPGHALARDTSTEAAQILSEAINTLSGGTRYTAGILSPTPDQIDYLAGQIGGGVWREVSKAEQTVRSAITGESLPPYKVPLLGRLFGSAKSQASEGNSFYGHVERLNRIETELKGLRRDGNTQEAAELRSRFPEAYLITQANYAERKVQKLRAKKRDLLRAGAPRERVKEIEDQITSTMASLNRAVEALQAN